MQYLKGVGALLMREIPSEGKLSVQNLERFWGVVVLAMCVVPMGHESGKRLERSGWFLSQSIPGGRVVGSGWGGGGWFLLFSRPFNDWELEEVQIFLQVIQGKRVISNQDDVLLMKDVKGGCFSMNHFYLQLALVRDSLFPFRFVWNP